MKIELIEKEVMSETSYFDVALEVNGKEVNASVWFSCDQNLGETDRGYEIIDGDLTEIEAKELKNVIYSLVERGLK